MVKFFTIIAASFEKCKKKIEYFCKIAKNKEICSLLRTKLTVCPCVKYTVLLKCSNEKIGKGAEPSVPKKQHLEKPIKMFVTRRIIWYNDFTRDGKLGLCGVLS